MTGISLTPADSEIDLALRILTANRLPFQLLADVLGTTVERVDAAAAGAPMPLSPAEREKLGVFLAIMIRIEIRFGHEPHDVRKALVTPYGQLKGRTPEQAMTQGLESLRAVHHAVEELALPATRWWRVPPRR